MNRVLSRLGLTAVVLVAGSASLSAQTTTGSLDLIVKDSKGNPVAGARIDLRSASGSSRIGVTNEQGVFRAPLLPPGAYTGTVVKDGFKTTGLQASVPLGGNTTAVAVMQMVDTPSVVVEVVGTQSKVDKSDVSGKENYVQDDILKLPVGRTLQGIVQLAPGVTTGSGGRPVINGAATYENKYLVDGTDVNDNFFNTDDGLFIEDAIAETQVLQNNVSAEYGRFTGGVINAITKTGTNEFAGTLRASMVNPSWNAVLPKQNRAAIVSKLGTTYTFTVGGPIIKDSLWFFVAGRFVSRNDTNSTPFTGLSYNTKTSEDRYEANLAWQINNSNHAQVTYTHRKIDIGPRAPLVANTASLDGLQNRSDKFSLLSLSYDSILTDWLTLSLKYSEKKHLISSSDNDGNGGTAFWQSPVFDNATGALFNNHYFGNADENRDNQSMSATLSAFFSAAGDHSLKVGFERFRETDDGTNAQSPTGFDINADVTYTFGSSTPAPTYSFNANSYIDDWTKAPGGVFHNTYDSAYIQDNWAINKHFNASIGVRYEKWSGKSNAGYLTPSYSVVVPRVGLNYDVNGDSVWQWNVTYAEYSGKLNDSITAAATPVGNPALYDYAYIGAPVSGVTPAAGATGFQRSDYSTVPFSVSDPTLNVSLDPHIKAPLTKESAIGLTHKVSDTANWTLRYIYRDFTQMFEDYVGGLGTVTVGGNQYSNIVWGNTTSQNAQRTYHALQATWQDSFDLYGGRLSYFGNYTYSRLKGNYEGDGGNSPGGGTAIGNFPGDLPGAVAYGYLPNDQTHRFKLTAGWAKPIGSNTLTIGTSYDYATGSPWSISRTAYSTGTAYPETASGNQSYTQFLNGTRGQGRFNDRYHLDFSAQWDGKFVANSKIGYFVKLSVFDVFNNIQQVTFDTRYKLTGNPASAFAVKDPTTFGQATSQNNFTGARSLQVDLGFRF